MKQLEIKLALSKECKYHILGQYWYIRDVPAFSNTGMFQYLGSTPAYPGGGGGGGVQKECSHPMGLGQKQSNQPVLG